MHVYVSLRSYLHKGDGEFSSVAFTCSDEKGTISTIEILQDHLGFSPWQATVEPSKSSKNHKSSMYSDEHALLDTSFIWTLYMA